jgi:hypothetical protein
MCSSLCPKFHSNPIAKSLDFMKIGFICRCPKTPDVPSRYSGQCSRSIRTLRIIRNPASTSFFIASRLLLIDISCVQAMGRERAPASSGQRRQKHRHDPQIQEEEVSPPSPPQRELRPRHRPGKEPAGSSSQAHPPHQAP